MRRLTRVLVAAAVVSCAQPLTGPTGQWPERISLSGFAVGDEIRVTLHAYGCFHDVSALLSFAGTADGGARLTGSVTGNYRRDPERAIERTLEGAQLRDLDAWLAYYRDLPADVVCTSVTELDLALYRDGTLLRRERYRDNTCGGFEPPPLPATSFGTLIAQS